MSAIVTTVLKGTLGFLIKKGQQSASKKLKDGDVTDDQLRSWIVDEMDNVNTKLDAIAKKDLGASISFFKEGLVFLNKAMNTKPCGKDSLNAVPAAVAKDEDVEEDKRAGSGAKKTPEAAKRMASWSEFFSSLAPPWGNLFVQGIQEEEESEISPQINKETTSGAEKNEPFTLTGELREQLNSLGEEAIIDAKKRFEDARRKATEAFHNEVLSPLDRILAMGVRLMATILEKVDNPVSSLDACISGLNELHSMPFVTENLSVELERGMKSKFSKDERRQIISSVCQINRTIFDFTLLVRTEKVFSFWPCIEIGDEKIDPLRDSRVLLTLRKQEMGDYSLAWSFGQEGEIENQRLKAAVSIASNSVGQFLVVDSKDDCVKIFDSSGKFTKSFSPYDMDEFEKTVGGIFHPEYGLVSVATDRDDNIYVLEERMQARYPEARVYVFNHLAQYRYNFTVAWQFQAKTIKKTGLHLSLLVPGAFHLGGRILSNNAMSNSDINFVAVHDAKGKRMDRLSHENLTEIQDITAADDRIMILDLMSTVFVFTDESFHKDNPVSRFLEKFPVKKYAYAITFCPGINHVIIASKTQNYRSQLHFYTKEGKFVRSIDLDVERGYQITAATVTIDERICIAVNSESEQKGKALVL
ncbi:hypothetical protein ABFA07_022266 [Porites harrisoni]